MSKQSKKMSKIKSMKPKKIKSRWKARLILTRYLALWAALTVPLSLNTILTSFYDSKLETKFLHID